VQSLCNVLLIAPRFSGQSFWNFEAACEVYGARFPAPPLGLITVAALLPSYRQCRLVNRNTEELRGSDLDWADLVMTGGMLPQQPDTTVGGGAITASHLFTPSSVTAPDPRPVVHRRSVSSALCLCDRGSWAQARSPHWLLSLVDRRLCKSGKEKPWPSCPYARSLSRKRKLFTA
jgi:hypothetical protein